MNQNCGPADVSSSTAQGDIFTMVKHAANFCVVMQQAIAIYAGGGCALVCSRTRLLYSAGFWVKSM